MEPLTHLPIVTGFQMAAVDRAMVEVCGLDLVQVMEVAGRAVASVARILQPTGTVAVLCGSGGNGGDGFVCARHLVGWGFDACCWPVKPVDEYHGLAAHNLRVCQRIGVPISGPGDRIEFDGVDLIIDGLFGFGLSAAPSGRAVQLIEAASCAPARVLAIDIPSGIDATTGRAHGAALSAIATLTLGLPKRGLLIEDGPTHAGTVIVADIGIPAAAYAAAGIPITSSFDSVEFVTLDGHPWPD